MEVSISSSITSALQHRDYPNRALHCTSEHLGIWICIPNFLEWIKKVVTKCLEYFKKLVGIEPPTVPSTETDVIARVGFYIHSETGQIQVTFSKDKSTHDRTKEELFEGKFISFSLTCHEFVAKSGSVVSITMECKKPEESKISVEGLQRFTVDKNFIAVGRHSVFFYLDPEPADDWESIHLVCKCSVDGKEGRSLPLKVKRPQKGSRKTEINYHFHGAVNHFVTGNARLVTFGGVNAADKRQDQSVTAGNIYEGDASINTKGGSVNVSRK